jgi:hypothetical protein
MKTKYIWLIVYSVVILYIGYKIRDYFITDFSNSMELVPDSALFTRWNERNKIESSQNGKNGKIVKPKIVKYQKTDSIMNSKLKENCNILEVRKDKDMIKVLSFDTSRLMESMFINGSDKFRISVQNGIVNYSESKEFFQFSGIKLGMGFRADVKTGNRTIFIESGIGLKAFNHFHFDLRMNSIPEMLLVCTYTFE